MNWLQKTSQSFSELSDELDVAQEKANWALEDIPSLRREVGGVPEITCPLIDKAIKQINDAIRVAKSGTAYDDPQNAFDEIEMELYDTEDLLENIRKHNGQLRNLGNYWYENYRSLNGEVQGLEQHLQQCQQMCSRNVMPVGTSPVNPL